MLGALKLIHTLIWAFFVLAIPNLPHPLWRIFALILRFLIQPGCVSSEELIFYITSFWGFSHAHHASPDFTIFGNLHLLCRSLTSSNRH